MHMDVKQNILRKPFPYRQFNVAYILAGISVVLFLLESFMQLPILQYLKLYPLPFNELNQAFPGNFPETLGFYPWQFVSYMFMHAPLSQGIWHILFNMLFLVLIGTHVERHVGSWEFLFMYLLMGILSGITAFIFYNIIGSWVPVVGASGALFAVLLMFATFYPEAKIYIYGIFPVNAKLMVLFYTGLTVFNIVTSAQDGISHIAHFGGLIFGFIYFVVRYGKNPFKIWFPNRFQG
jgi:membrane associated rhomboid family serine protease